MSEETAKFLFDIGFVVDFGNGIVAENYDEYEQLKGEGIWLNQNLWIWRKRKE